MVEIWKDISGYENLYQVSNLGNVVSLKHKKPFILKQIKNRNGYLRVGLKIYNKPVKLYLVHRLVAQAFIPNPQNLPFVNHKDENKTNNMASNLEFCTQAYNNRYGTALERRSKKLTNRKDQSKPVLQYDKYGNFIKEYPSASDASRNTGINFSHICKVCRGELNTSGGYIWKYKQS